MTARPLACTRCGAQAAVVDDTRGQIDHGPAVVDPDGTVRPDTAHVEASEYPENTAVLTHQTYAVCTSSDCGHRWRLRRRFDPNRENGAQR